MLNYVYRNARWRAIILHHLSDLRQFFSVKLDFGTSTSNRVYLITQKLTQ